MSRDAARALPNVVCREEPAGRRHKESSALAPRHLAWVASSRLGRGCHAGRRRTGYGSAAVGVGVLVLSRGAGRLLWSARLRLPRDGGSTCRNVLALPGYGVIV